MYIYLIYHNNYSNIHHTYYIQVAEKFVYGEDAINRENERINNSLVASTSNIYAVALKDGKISRDEKKRLENRKWSDNKIAPSPVDILKKKFTTEVEHFDKCFVCMGTGLASKMIKH